MAVTHFDGEFLHLDEVRMSRLSLAAVSTSAHHAAALGNGSLGGVWSRVDGPLRRLKRTLTAV